MKSSLVTILGATGISLIKGRLGSANDPDLPEQFGFLWYKVKIKSLRSYDLYDFNDFNDFKTLVKYFVKFYKKYQDKEYREILEDAGIELDDEGNPMIGDYDEAVQDVLEYNFKYFSSSVDDVLSYRGLGFRIFSKLLYLGSLFNSVKEIPRKNDEFYIQVNLSKVLGSGTTMYFKDKSGFELIKSVLYFDIDRIKNIFEVYMDETGQNLESSISITLVEPKDKRMLVLLATSELRKF